jgi:hypothetical protein
MREDILNVIFNLIAISVICISLLLLFGILIISSEHTNRIVKCAENNQTYFEYNTLMQGVIYCGDVSEFSGIIKEQLANQENEYVE